MRGRADKLLHRRAPESIGMCKQAKRPEWEPGSPESPAGTACAHSSRRKKSGLKRASVRRIVSPTKACTAAASHWSTPPLQVRQAEHDVIDSLPCSWPPAQWYTSHRQAGLPAAHVMTYLCASSAAGRRRRRSRARSSVPKTASWWEASAAASMASTETDSTCSRATADSAPACSDGYG